MYNHLLCQFIIALFSCTFVFIAARDYLKARKLVFFSNTPKGATHYLKAPINSHPLPISAYEKHSGDKVYLFKFGKWVLFSEISYIDHTLRNKIAN